MTMPESVHVRLKRDDSGYPPYEMEEVPAVRVGEHRFRLSAPPTFAHGLAAADIVTVRHHVGEGALPWIETLARPGGHSTIRVIGLAGRSPDEPRRLANELGCRVFETVIDTMIAIDVPRDADIRALYAALREDRGRSWDFDVGVLSDEHDRQIGEAD